MAVTDRNTIASQKQGISAKRAEVLKAHQIRKGQVLNPWGCKGKDGTITDLITKQARAIAAERVKTESGASTTLLDAAIRKLVQLGLVQGDVQALTAFLDLVRGHRLKADVALSGDLNVNATVATSITFVGFGADTKAGQ